MTQEVIPISSEIVQRQESDDWMPVFSIQSAVQRRDQIVEFVKRIMVPNTDFGVIPGTKSKPVLLKPGAERLCSFFGLSPEFLTMDEASDWTGVHHNGEPFFYVKYQCRLSRNGKVIGSGEGSCSSWESKYRYRQGERKCPSCNGAFIIKGKQEYGGGWLCFAKKGGCGAKFSDGDKSIEGQSVERVPNPDVADQVNTIQKMAQKRALIAAVLIGVNASEFFTQDLEDMPGSEPQGSQAAADAVAASKIEAMRNEKPPLTETLKKSVDEASTAHVKPFSIKDSIYAFASLKQTGLEEFGDDWKAEYYRILGAHGVEHSNGLKTPKAARECYKALSQRLIDMRRAAADAGSEDEFDKHMRESSLKVVTDKDVKAALKPPSVLEDEQRFPVDFDLPWCKVRGFVYHRERQDDRYCWVPWADPKGAA